MKIPEKIMKFSLILFVLMFFLPFYCFAQSEQITVESYFPARYGNYDEVHADKLAIGRNATFGGTETPPDSQDAVLSWGTKRSSLKTRLIGSAFGSAIELGGVGSQPYIDFSNDPTSDYTARIYLDNTQNLVFSKVLGSTTRIFGLETCDRVVVGGGDDPASVCSTAGVMSRAVYAGNNYGAGVQYGYVMCCRCSCDAGSPGCGC